MAAAGFNANFKPNRIAQMVTSSDKDENGQPSTSGTKPRMDEALRQMLKTPPKPHKDFTGKGGKGPKPPAPKARNFRHQGR